MAEKILYFLGAGASAEALPLAKSVGGTSIEPQIPGLAYSLKKINLNSLLVKLIDKNYQHVLNTYKHNFGQLADKADEFGDVDTYAKYLHLMHPGGEELQELKRTLSAYFSINQLILGAKDKRYLPWLVTIMNRKIFPENVKILSWNYDFQVELAAAQIGNFEDVEWSETGFTHSPPLFSYFPNLDPTFSDYKLLSLIHLNGIAGFAMSENSRKLSIFQKRFSKSTDSSLLFLEENNLHTQMHFAWEGGNYHNPLMSHVKNMIEGTTIMVVIGYSFPFFNREFDKQIFSELTKNGNFRKIYYQDPVLNGQQLRSQFGLSAHIEITHIQNKDNFHVPFEY